MFVHRLIQDRLAVCFRTLVVKCIMKKSFYKLHDVPAGISLFN